MVLEVQDLHVNYGSIRALRGVSLTVASGQVVVLLGANGAGKSTLLRAVSNLVPLESGRITLWGESTAGLPAHAVAAKGVAHVPEGRGVFAQLSVRENLVIGAYLAPPHDIGERFEEVLTLFPQLRERWHQPAGTLSGGEQQMVALARALVMHPKLLLLDEPSLGLAPLLAQETFRTIGRIHQSGVAVLLVEQNARLALSLADYVYVLRNGTIEVAGEAQEVTSHDAVRRAYLGVG